MKWVVIQLILFGYIGIINLEKKTNRKCNASIVKIFFSKLNLIFLIGVYWVSKACNGRGRVRQESIQKTWKCSLLNWEYYLKYFNLLLHLILLMHFWNAFWSLHVLSFQFFRPKVLFHRNDSMASDGDCLSHTFNALSFINFLIKLPSVFLFLIDSLWDHSEDSCDDDYWDLNLLFILNINCSLMYYKNFFIIIYKIWTLLKVSIL